MDNNDYIQIHQLTHTTKDCPNDPLEFYELITNHANEKHTGLFFNTNVDKRIFEKCIIMKRAAIKVECQGSHITLSALTSLGKHLLKNILNLSEEKATITLSISSNQDISNLTDEERLLQPSAFDILRTFLKGFATKNFINPTCLLGIFSFDLIELQEKLTQTHHDPLEFPDYLFYVPEETISIDYQKKECCFTILTTSTEEKAALEQLQDLMITSKEHLNAQNLAGMPVQKEIPIQYSHSDEEFCEIVRECQSHIAMGDAFQIVASRRFSIPCHHPFLSFKYLVKNNFSPYLFFFNTEHHIIFGASPETCVKVEKDEQSNKRVSLNPIAGTRPRGFNDKGEIDVEKDIKQETALRICPKELAEHMMLVDLARNDISRISMTGSCQVKELTALKRFSKVMHLCSHVEGILQPHFDALHAYAACMNMGTLTGAPKIKATNLLRKYENEKRGPYGGGIGWINSNGEMDTAITIRTAVVINSTAHIRSGAGIVADSDPISEANETTHKASAVINSIIQANLWRKETQ